MFGLFRRKRLNKKRKIHLINKIEAVSKELYSGGLSKVSAQLDRIVTKLDREDLKLSKEQAESIDKCVDTIAAHASKPYESLLLNKCTHINAAIDSNEAASDIMKASGQNEDKLFELLGKISEIDASVKDIDVKMDAALGKNKNLWQMLNAQRSGLKNQALVITKSYNTLLALQNNAALAHYVKDACDLSEDIADQNAVVDIQDFTDNADYVSSVQNEVNETANRMNESFAKNFGTEDSDYAYEKALEEKYLAQSGVSAEEVDKANS